MQRAIDRTTLGLLTLGKGGSQFVRLPLGMRRRLAAVRFLDQSVCLPVPSHPSRDDMVGTTLAPSVTLRCATCCRWHISSGVTEMAISPKEEKKYGTDEMGTLRGAYVATPGNGPALRAFL